MMVSRCCTCKATVCDASLYIACLMITIIKKEILDVFSFLMWNKQDKYLPKVRKILL